MIIPKNVKCSNPLLYNKLENPIFIGQTECDDNGEYIQVFVSNGIRYYFKACL